MAKTEYVVEGLRRLVNAARLGRFFYSGWGHELLYTFIKVPEAVWIRDLHKGIVEKGSQQQHQQVA